MHNRHKKYDVVYSGKGLVWYKPFPPPTASPQPPNLKINLKSVWPLSRVHFSDCFQLRSSFSNFCNHQVSKEAKCMATCLAIFWFLNNFTLVWQYERPFHIGTYQSLESNNAWFLFYTHHKATGQKDLALWECHQVYEINYSRDLILMAAIVLMGFHSWIRSTDAITMIKIWISICHYHSSLSVAKKNFSEIIWEAITVIFWMHYS